MSDGNEKLYNFKARSDDSGLVCDQPSMTVQSQMEDADINTIVRRFGITGQLPQGMVAPVYADYEGVFDYHSAQLAVVEGARQFMLLDANTRSRFNNDPGMFFAYAVDPDNIEGMRDLGLAIRPVVSDNVVKPGDVPPAVIPT